MKHPARWRASILLACFAMSAAAQPAAPTVSVARYAAADRVVDDYRRDAHVPGMVYGVVADGRLIHIGSFGVQDIVSNRPVDADTVFRIASMTKAFTALTILSLRDQERVRLDTPAADYVPELRAWKYPTTDTAPIRVRDLLNHTAGFVTDDPWGDRQTPMLEADFTRLLNDGVPFTNVPGMRFEYSNLGYALLGRIITNVSKQPYDQTIARTLLQPLGMQASGFVAGDVAPSRRALGYRWEDNAWRLEPTLGPGVFGAMGGLHVSANDYAKWVAYLLSAWPPRDGADDGPVRRASVRELAQGSNFARFRKRPARAGAPASRQSIAYGMGMNAAIDDDLGFTLSHSGGYPGYGSHVLLLPDRGIGVFAFTNRTYGGASVAVWDAAMALDKAGLLGSERTRVPGRALSAAYATAGAIYRAGSLAVAGDQLAMNFLLDREANGWAMDLAKLKGQVGSCDTGAAISPTGELTGDFVWRCAHGRVKGSLNLAPTHPAGIQELLLAPILP